MDYLEGMLLHSWWADTDYSTRKHKGMWFFYSVVMNVLLFVAFIKINMTAGLDILAYQGLFTASLIILFIISPLICGIYYKLPFILRIVDLAILAWKYVSLFALLIMQTAQRLVLPEGFDLNYIIAWGNITIGDFLTETTANSGVSGLFIGAVMIGLIVLVIAIISLLVLIFTPILALYLFNSLQFIWDEFVKMLIAKTRKLYENYNEKEHFAAQEKQK